MHDKQYWNVHQFHYCISIFFNENWK